MKFRILGFAILPLACLACTGRTSYLEDRARKQLSVSIEYDLGQNVEKEILDLKTVYVNDSICLLQCCVKFKDVMGKDQYQDLRYTYLIDFMESHFAGKAVYKENFEFIANMPDEYIKLSKKKAKKDRESVYSYMYGGTYPIAKPFDE